MLSALRCSVCKESLHIGAACVKCSNGHSFDLSKDGYINLLLSKKGVPKEMGDRREMLNARRSFLEEGYFDCFYDELIHRTKSYLLKRKDETLLNVVDVGCGEGYYLGKLTHSLDKESAQLESKVESYGIDLSKDAVRLASRKYKRCRFLLSNARHEIPFIDGSISVISSIFSPRKFDEFARILKPGGLFLVAIPTPEHLVELRHFVNILKIDDDKEIKLLDHSEDFKFVESMSISDSRELELHDLRNILNMTPNFWHNPDLASLSNMTGKLSVTFSVRVLEFERR